MYRSHPNECGEVRSHCGCFHQMLGALRWFASTELGTTYGLSLLLANLNISEFTIELGAVKSLENAHEIGKTVP